MMNRNKQTAWLLGLITFMKSAQINRPVLQSGMGRARGGLPNPGQRIPQPVFNPLGAIRLNTFSPRPKLKLKLPTSFNPKLRSVFGFSLPFSKRFNPRGKRLK